MLKFYFYGFLPIFFVGIFSFVGKRKHLLSTLLSVEFIFLSLFFFMFALLAFSLFDLFFLMYFLGVSVCEGALGLSVLVSMIRSHGSDYFSSFNIIQC
uniref:NADH-ubiquinone oxidoreductase chain 4L n=1 Tax=Vestalis melania TaxID=1199063 RepID=V9ITI0_9ODON|nr:NADH dehydrogenase subunit 4L [Vestalis melania]AFM83575.1 NADH dehydrogenase subunit 4L [Vestalis melania]